MRLRSVLPFLLHQVSFMSVSLLSLMPFLSRFVSPVVPGFSNGAIIDCSIRLLQDKVEQLRMGSSRRRTEAADDATETPISRRAIDPHLGHSIVAMCAPKACPIPGLLVSCSRQKTIVVWYSGNEYVSYNAHADGARCRSICCHALFLSRCSLTLLPRVVA